MAILAPGGGDPARPSPRRVPLHAAWLALLASGCVGARSEFAKPEEGGADPLSLYAQASVARAVGDLAVARDRLERAARLAPDRAIVFEDLGEVLLTLGELGPARGAFERAAALDAEDLDPVVRLARLDLIEKEPAAALARLMAAVAREPAQADALELLHPLLLWAGDSETGRSLFERAAELRPGSAQVREAHADFLVLAGREDEAMEEYRRSLALDRRRRGAEVKLARLLERLAERRLEEIRASGPRAGAEGGPPPR